MVCCWKVFAALFIVCPSLMFAAPQPKREIRAVWLTTYSSLDFPKIKATSPASAERQREELCQMLDELQQCGINVVFFQARLRGDVAYRSQIEPMSSAFTGRSGGDPFYDPLAFAVQECHRRGMECHAWVVATRMGAVQSIAWGGKNIKTVRHEGQYFLDPGLPVTEEYLAALTREVVGGYDIDGIQFDYLRYPENAQSFPDAAIFKQHSGGQNKAKWRTDNITRIMRRLYCETKAIKPYVKVSSCPIGKYADLPRYPAGGFTARDAVSQDAKTWLKEGIQDWVVPMLYYRGNYFYPFVLDWLTAAGNKPVVAGLGAYFLSPTQTNGNWALSDVDAQLQFLRANNAGASFFRARHLIDNIKGIRALYANKYAAYPALVPKMADGAPEPPMHLKVERIGAESVLTFTGDEMHNIYASNTYPVNTDSAQNIVAVRVQGNKFTYNNVKKPFRRYFAVTTYDRYNRESPPCQMPKPLQRK